MVVRSLDTNKDPFCPLEHGEKIIGPEVPYLSAIGALSYLANCTRPDIAFSVNLLARYSSSPTRRHWNGYADAGYLSDPHKAKSQTGYVFTRGGTAISWKSTKQTLTATSSNHSEIIAMHEASREYNTACIAQLKGGNIKGDRTKHISPKFFYTHELQKKGDIDVQQIRSSDNVADLFTKALPTSTFKKLVFLTGFY
ncbi:secreted RxLR effector protein 161-like [Primulina tabacum]|uniref:secreted RxLR effector protein 161-like n=1 Tax=Primulina tabacum TaxID=48773 RepID=UPI003F59E561